MNWIMALVAFAGLMTILSTIVTITVEAIHKVFSMRKTGLQEMLRAMHDNVIADLEAGRRPNQNVLRNNGGSKEATEFARAMTKSPTFGGGGGRWWWPSNWGLNIFQRRFERLTKRQFAEQLAQTSFGRQLADRDRSTIRRALAHTAYEFDRYGVAQSDFFRRRAKVLSGLVAFGFVSLANVNAIDIYMHLALDEAALGRTMALIEGNDLQAMADEAAAVEARLAGKIQDLNLQARAVSDASTLEETRTQLEMLRETRASVASSISGISGYTGLPIGRNFFPYCGDIALDAEKCAGFSGVSYEVMFTDFEVPQPLVRLAHSPGDGIMWILSLIATAGLLGLGAPFWYGLAARAASIAGMQANVRPGSGQPTPSIAAASAVRNGHRGTEEPEIDELADAFLISAGKVDMPYPISLPIGMRLGEASADAQGTGPTASVGNPAQPQPAPTARQTGAEPPSGIRRPPRITGGRRS